VSRECREITSVTPGWGKKWICLLVCESGKILAQEGVLLGRVLVTVVLPFITQGERPRREKTLSGSKGVSRLSPISRHHHLRLSSEKRIGGKILQVYYYTSLQEELYLERKSKPSK